jgi:radical SAM protein with 4Fe4S-binding SPASM domain
MKNHPHEHMKHGEQRGDGPLPRLIAWELTRTCNLSCIHCRAASIDKPYPNELTTEECMNLLDEVASFASPIMILTGGEPLLRPDLFEIATYGTEKGLRMVLATNGLLIDTETTKKMREASIQRVSISLDGATAESHDKFRQVAGAFAGSLRGIDLLKKASIEFQINTTITSFKEQEIAAKDYEQTLNWFYDQSDKVDMQLKATCAPHYYRIMRQRAKEEGKKVTVESHGMDAVTRGCLGGTAFLFISHVGQVQPCGYLEVDCGNVRQAPLGEIWRDSEVLKNLRNFEAYQGRCGVCEYRKVCGGCRARAFEATGDYLQEEPLCTYVPRAACR